MESVEGEMLADIALRVQQMSQDFQYVWPS